MAPQSYILCLKHQCEADYFYKLSVLATTLRCSLDIRIPQFLYNNSDKIFSRRFHLTNIDLLFITASSSAQLTNIHCPSKLQVLLQWSWFLFIIAYSLVPSLPEILKSEFNREQKWPQYLLCFSLKCHKTDLHCLHFSQYFYLPRSH